MRITFAEINSNKLQGVTLLVSERLSDSIISELSDDTLSSSGGIRFSQCETFVVV